MDKRVLPDALAARLVTTSRGCWWVNFSDMSGEMVVYLNVALRAWMVLDPEVCPPSTWKL